MAKIPYRREWADVPAYTGGPSETLELGGHYLQILHADMREGHTQNGPWQGIRIMFDTHETDCQPGFFRRKYDNSRQWAERDGKDPKWPNDGTGMVFIPQEGADKRQIGRYNGFIKMLESSNPGWKWDFTTESLRGKLIGGVFRDEEWEFEGRTGMAQKLAWFCDVEKVPEATIPEPRMLQRKVSRPTPAAPYQDDTDLPFDL